MERPKSKKRERKEKATFCLDEKITQIFKEQVRAYIPVIKSRLQFGMVTHK